jgi:hypothetical protein
MSVAGTVFVTPHAIQRFQERIAPIPEDVARAVIIRGLQRALGYHQTRLRDGRVAYEVASHHAGFTFIASVVPNPDPSLLPAVVTILWGSRGQAKPGGGRRKPVWERNTWTRCS